MSVKPQTPSGECNPPPSEPDLPETLDPNDSERLADKLKGQTSEHATPPRLEDEGQSGG